MSSYNPSRDSESPRGASLSSTPSASYGSPQALSQNINDSDFMGSPPTSSDPSPSASRSASRSGSRSRRRTRQRPLPPTGVGWTPRALTLPSGEGSSSPRNSRQRSPVRRGADAPAWLSSALSEAPKSPPVEGTPEYIAAICEARVNDIVNTALLNSDAIPKLAKVVEDLEYNTVASEMDDARNASRATWRALERVRRAENELAAVEAKLEKLNYRSALTASKIKRLQLYEQFILDGWPKTLDTKNRDAGNREDVCEGSHSD